MFSDENDENQPKWLKRRNRVVRSSIYKVIVVILTVYFILIYY